MWEHRVIDHFVVGVVLNQPLRFSVNHVYIVYICCRSLPAYVASVAVYVHDAQQSRNIFKVPKDNGARLDPTVSDVFMMENL